MTLIKHNHSAPSLHHFGPLLNGFFGRDIAQVVGSDIAHTQQARVNIVETKDSFRIALSAPGFRKEDLKTEVRENTLTISGTASDAALNEDERYTRREFRSSNFSRAFELPEHVDTANIAATYADGVLTITVPKQEPVTPAVRNITIG